MDKKVGNIYLGASSILTALGNLEENVSAMAESRSGIAWNDLYAMHTASIDTAHPDAEVLKGYTRFESYVVSQIGTVAAESGIDLSSPDVQLIISTTKGNISLLEECCDPVPERTYIYTSAELIAAHFNAANKPIVISNACISGVSAFVVAKNLFNGRGVKHVVIAGCDLLSDFIAKGFSSFKSISARPCRPYDEERDGLTLGEACGAIVLTKDEAMAKRPLICLAGGAVSNDANHISGPSRTGDGLFFAVDNAMKEAGVETGDIGFVNTHGTATRYNDEMESKAVAWAKMEDKPLNSLKGYIGHTLGASGVVETILCAEQLRASKVFATYGFEKPGTPHVLNITTALQPVSEQACVKTASGFGGCNAAVVLTAGDCRPAAKLEDRAVCMAEYILPQSELPFAEFIRQEFKAFESPNMKFYKMSDLSKALYVAVENLLSVEGLEDIEPARRAIVMTNRSASLDADVAHQLIVNQHNVEGASPAVFVYTLPNVATGEMCIRHKIMGDNTFFIENEYSGFAEEYSGYLINSGQMDAVICGWCDYLDEKWKVEVKLLKTK